MPFLEGFCLLSISLRAFILRSSPNSWPWSHFLCLFSLLAPTLRFWSGIHSHFAPWRRAFSSNVLPCLWSLTFPAIGSLLSHQQPPGHRSDQSVLELRDHCLIYYLLPWNPCSSKRTGCACHTSALSLEDLQQCLVLFSVQWTLAVNCMHGWRDRWKDTRLCALWYIPHFSTQIPLNEWIPPSPGRWQVNTFLQLTYVNVIRAAFALLTMFAPTTFRSQ